MAALVLLPALLVAAGFSLRAQPLPSPLGDFLKQYAGFGNGDLQHLAEGQPVATVMETKEGDEIALAGAIRIAVSSDFFLQQFKDITRFKRSKAVTEIGKFGDPPALADLAGLHLTENTLTALRQCRVGNCNVKLSAKEIERISKDTAWNEPNAARTATRGFREMLLQRVLSYEKSGNAGLADYADKTPPESLADVSTGLLGESPYLEKYAPQLEECLLFFPRCAPGIGGFVYWSKETYHSGLRPVISVTQVLIDRVKVGGSDWTWAASKQLYADHYSNGSLGMTLMVDAAPENGRPSFYLVYLNRTRSDSLRGFFAFFIRGFIRGRARGELSQELERIRTRIQTLWNDDHPSADQPPNPATRNRAR